MVVLREGSVNRIFKKGFQAVEAPLPRQGSYGLNRMESMILCITARYWGNWLGSEAAMKL